MTPRLQRREEGTEKRPMGSVCRGGKDGEIKGTGPFSSMSLVVLENFRDLDFPPGPGFRVSCFQIKGLSGTFRRSRRHG